MTIDWRDWVNWGTGGTELSVEMNGAPLSDSGDDRIGDVSLGSSDSNVMDPADLESPSSSDESIIIGARIRNGGPARRSPVATPLGTLLRTATSATCHSSAPRQFWYAARHYAAVVRAVSIASTPATSALERRTP